MKCTSGQQRDMEKACCGVKTVYFVCMFVYFSDIYLILDINISEGILPVELSYWQCVDFQENFHSQSQRIQPEISL